MVNEETGSAPPMVSIIVPVFNAADYLLDCLESIDAQDFRHAFEVIVINDCSTDKSAELCRDWMETRSARFSLIENERNLGVSLTRNRGLEMAKGRYFMFVDADDILPRKALSRLFDAAERFEVDIVKGNNTRFDRKRETAARHNVGKTVLIENDAVLTTLYQHDRVRGHPWGKLFRRDRLGDIRFLAGVRMAEDLVYCSEVFARARSLLLLDRTVYRYRKSKRGASGSKYRTGSYLDWLEAIETSAKFASIVAHRRAHKGLLIRTMAQLARECRHLPPQQAIEVLSILDQRREKWQIRMPRLILKDKLGLRSLARYAKMRRAIRQIRKAVNGN